MRNPDTPKNAIAPGLVILHANRLESLRDLAIEFGRSYPLAPLENDVFLVQSNGMAQWLKLAFAGGDGLGISAALQFLMPSRFLWQAYRQVLGAAAVPKTSPFDESRLVWRLYRWLSHSLPNLPESGWQESEKLAMLYAPLRRYLHDTEDAGKCFALAQKLADLFDQYQVYRADWLNAWQAGFDVLPAAAMANEFSAGRAPDLLWATPPSVPEAQRWQPALWRALTAEVAVSLQQSGRSHVHQAFLDALRSKRYVASGLPRRLQVFGLSSMSTQMLEAIDALAKHVQVLVYVVNPCPHYWVDIMDGREMLGVTRHRHQRKPGLPPMLPLEQVAVKANPLLAAWGKQGRDFIGMLYRYDPDEVSHSKIDLFESPIDAGTDCLLTRIQNAIFDLQPLPSLSSAGAESRQPVAAGDRSLQFHICHSRQREVEVLHDRLLDLFEQHPELQPRDVIVMAPDIDGYAAHVEAVFGNVGREDARYIPYTLADRPERACHPMAAALASLLRLPDLRFTVSDLLGLLEVAALRQRFAINETELPVLQRWMAQSGIRWGLHAEQRESLGLPTGLHENTWQFGLRRLLLGYASGAGEPWINVEPFAGVAGLEGALAGKLLQAVNALESLWQSLRVARSVDDWVQVLLVMLGTFFLPQDDTDELLLRRFENAIREWQQACVEGGIDGGSDGTILPLVVVREALQVALDSEGLSQRFLAGCVNFCTLMPMRSIPFRVVCLLGMNDGDYPRNRVPLDFDLMNGRYRPGDRSRREDDRYLFLEALLSARQFFYISYIGRSIRDDSERPPSVLIAQLRDYVNAAFCLADGKNASENEKLENKQDAKSDLVAHLTMTHPLQPFSVNYFKGVPQWFTYAQEWRDVHETPQRDESPEYLPPHVREEPLTLSALERFLRQPVTYFFEERLKVRFPRDEMQDVDCEAFALDSLDAYQMGSLLIDARRVNATPFEETVARWRREGRLPAGAWGELAVAPVLGAAGQVWNALADEVARYPQMLEPLEIRLSVADVNIEDWVSGIVAGPAGKALHSWRPSKSRGQGSRGIKYHYFVKAFVTHVCLAAQGCALQDEPVQAVLIAADKVYRLPVLTQAQAIAQLEDWIGAWKQGLMRPLPVAFKSAMAYLQAANGSNVADPLLAARKTYESSNANAAAEVDESPAFLRSYPHFDEMTDFASWAQRLYGGLQQWLAAEADA